HEAAIKSLKRAISLSPQSAYPHTLIAHEYLSTEEYEKAHNHFCKAIAIDQRHHNAIFGLGHLYFQQEKWKVAETQFRKALKLNPRNPVFLSQLGLTMQKLGRFDEALEFFDRASACSPEKVTFLFRKADCLVLMKRDEDAQKILEHLTETSKSELAVHFLLGQIYKRQGHTAKALRMFTMAKDDAIESKSASRIIETIGKVQFVVVLD
ncbi:hypothetical protein HK096_010047, partial [Nowakowskiella sp. JEL0078]